MSQAIAIHTTSSGSRQSFRSRFRARRAQRRALVQFRSLAADRGALWLSKQLRGAGVRESAEMSLEQLAAVIFAVGNA